MQSAKSTKGLRRRQSRARRTNAKANPIAKTSCSKSWRLWRSRVQIWSRMRQARQCPARAAERRGRANQDLRSPSSAAEAEERAAGREDIVEQDQVESPQALRAGHEKARLRPRGSRRWRYVRGATCASPISSTTLWLASTASSFARAVTACSIVGIVSRNRESPSRSLRVGNVLASRRALGSR